MRCPKLPVALVGAALALAATQPVRAEAPSSESPEQNGFEVPGGDIFGFTDPTDVGDKGEIAGSRSNSPTSPASGAGATGRRR